MPAQTLAKNQCLKYIKIIFFKFFNDFPRSNFFKKYQLTVAKMRRSKDIFDAFINKTVFSYLIWVTPRKPERHRFEDGNAGAQRTTKNLPKG